MADIYIDLETLNQVVTNLNAIITEFENANSSSEELEGDIRSPYDRDELRKEAREFEERWDDKRSELKESLQGVRDHVQGVIDGVQEADADMAIALEGEE